MFIFPTFYLPCMVCVLSLFACLVVQCALLLRQPWCTLPCDNVVFSIWIAVTVSIESSAYEPTTVTAETTVMARGDRKADSVYRWPWVCLYVSVSLALSLSLSFVFNPFHLRPVVSLVSPRYYVRFGDVSQYKQTSSLCSTQITWHFMEALFPPDSGFTITRV